MRFPTKINRNRIATNSRKSLPAPYGGWNARDSIANMDEIDARALVNLIPRNGFIELRKGYTTHASGMTGEINTIMQWAGPESQQMFAAVTSSIFDVTSSGAVGAADVSGLADSKWQAVMFTTAGGDFLVTCNDASADAVRNYDGTTWTTPTLTGAPGTPAGGNFNNVIAHKERLFFIEKNTMSYWVLPIQSIAGTATEVPVGSFTVKGGHLVAQATWTLDGGTGIDDFLVTITSEGETLVFQGTDPTDANNWAMVGRFNLGRPAGRRCFEKIGGDLLVLTEDGYVSLGRALISGRSNPNEATSDKIRNAVIEAMETSRNKLGWQAVLFPKAGLIIVNVPVTEGVEYDQHVFSLASRAWCEFNLPSRSWGFLGDDLYFGGSGIVNKFWDGFKDDAVNVVGELQQAFSDFSAPGRVKHYKLARPIIEGGTSDTVTLGIAMDVDFKETTSFDLITIDTENAEWRSLTTEGFHGGLTALVAPTTITEVLKWSATDIMFEVGNGI